MHSLCQGEWVIAPFIVHSSAHGHISIALFSQHLSIFTPPSVQQRASAMPPLVIASAHTQGTLVSFLQSFEPCHGPFFGFYKPLLPSWQSPHLFFRFFCTSTLKFVTRRLVVLPHFLSFCLVCVLLSLIIPSIEVAVVGVYGEAAVLCHRGLLIGDLACIFLFAASASLGEPRGGSSAG